MLGKVVSDITLAGAGRFSSDENKLYLGTVSRSAGISHVLRILVKGPFRNEVRLTVGKTDPAGVLKATIGEKKEIADGTVFLYPLTIEVAKDSPAAESVGNGTGRGGRGRD